MQFILGMVVGCLLYAAFPDTHLGYVTATQFASAALNCAPHGGLNMVYRISLIDSTQRITCNNGLGVIMPYSKEGK